MMVAKAVAGALTATERAEGSTAAVTGGDSAAQGSSNRVARSKTPPPKLPACRQTPDGLITSARTSSLARPGLNADQLVPWLVLRKTPPPDVAV